MEILTEEQIETVQQLAASMNERLDSYSLGNATKALNLSCSIAILPCAVIILAVFLLSRFNWIMTAIATILLGAISFLLANLASSLSRSRSMEKLYSAEIRPEIDAVLEENQISWSQFVAITGEVLPTNAPLPFLMEKETS